ncbi:collagen alpha-2(I) chain-like [Eschrichtius robustus]|uniref:collagen alpha-2(I) chain-like n=1 Tax=Eschrichtius robustus TaxID=9764 RepID=UPI0035C15CCC
MRQHHRAHTAPGSRPAVRSRSSAASRAPSRGGGAWGIERPLGPSALWGPTEASLPDQRAPSAAPCLASWVLLPGAEQQEPTSPQGKQSSSRLQGASRRPSSSLLGEATGGSWKKKRPRSPTPQGPRGRQSLLSAWKQGTLSAGGSPGKSSGKSQVLRNGGEQAEGSSGNGRGAGGGGGPHRRGRKAEHHTQPLLYCSAGYYSPISQVMPKARYIPFWGCSEPCWGREGLVRQPTTRWSRRAAPGPETHWSPQTAGHRGASGASVRPKERLRWWEPGKQRAGLHPGQLCSCCQGIPCQPILSPWGPEGGAGAVKTGVKRLLRSVGVETLRSMPQRLLGAESGDEGRKKSRGWGGQNRSGVGPPQNRSGPGLGWAARQPPLPLCAGQQKGQKLCSRLAGGCTGDVSQEPFLPEPWMRACYTTDLRIIRGEGSAGEKAVQPPGTPQAMVGDGAGQHRLRGPLAGHPQRGATASLRDSPPVPPAAPQKQHPWLGVRRDPWTPRPSLGLTAHPGCATSKTSRPLDPPPYSGKPQARHTLPGLTKAQPSHTAGTGPRPLVRRRPGGATEQSGLWKGVRGDPADTANGTRSTCLPTPSAPLAGTEPQEGLLPPPHQHLQTTWTELSRSLAGSRLNRQCPPARTHACQCWERLAQGQKRHLQPREMCQAPLCAVSPQNLAADPNGSAPPTTRQESSQGAAPRSLSPPRRPPKEPGPLTCPAPSDTHTPAGPLQHRGAPLRGLDLRSISAHQAAVAAGTRGAARAPSPRRPGPPPRAAAPPRVHGVPGAATGAARHLLCFRGAAPASIVSAAAAAAAAAAAVAGAAAAGPGAGVGAAGVGAPSAAGPGLGLGSGLGLGRHRPTGSEARGGLCARRARRADTTPRGGAARGERCHSCRPHHTPCPPRAGRGPGARARGRRRSAGVGRGAQAQSAGARAHTGACRPAPRPKPRDWEGGGAENRFALQRLGTCTESGSAPPPARRQRQPQHTRPLTAPGPGGSSKQRQSRGLDPGDPRSWDLLARSGFWEPPTACLSSPSAAVEEGQERQPHLDSAQDPRWLRRWSMETPRNVQGAQWGERKGRLSQATGPAGNGVAQLRELLPPGEMAERGPSFLQAKEGDSQCPTPGTARAPKVGPHQARAGPPVAAGLTPKDSRNPGSPVNHSSASAGSPPTQAPSSLQRAPPPTATPNIPHLTNPKQLLISLLLARLASSGQAGWVGRLEGQPPALVSSEESQVQCIGPPAPLAQDQVSSCRKQHPGPQLQL